MSIGAHPLGPALHQPCAPRPDQRLNQPPAHPQTAPGLHHAAVPVLLMTATKPWNACTNGISRPAPGCGIAGTITQAARVFTRPDKAQFRHHLQPMWRADSEAARHALHTGPLAPKGPRPSKSSGAMSTTTGPAWTPGSTPCLRGACPRAHPACCQGRLGRRGEKHRDHHQPPFQAPGRSWHPVRAARLLAIRQRLAKAAAWKAWRKTKLLGLITLKHPTRPAPTARFGSKPSRVAAGSRKKVPPWPAAYTAAPALHCTKPPPVGEPAIRRIS